MYAVTGHSFTKKCIFRKTYLIKVDAHINFLIIVSMNFSIMNLIQKQKINGAKMKTMDA